MEIVHAIEISKEGGENEGEIKQLVNTQVGSAS
jgi:hypothetical protein